MKKCRSIMTADMGYEPQTKTSKAMYQADTQEVLVVQTRTRESKYINNKSNYNTTLENIAPRRTTIVLRLGEEQRVGDIHLPTIEITIVTSTRSTISGTELGPDRAAATNPMTTKMTTATATGTAMVTEHAEMPTAAQSPTRKSATKARFPTPLKQVFSKFGSCAAAGGVLTLRERSRSS
jgi:hypothetical protein